jgi:plastocyanin
MKMEENSPKKNNTGLIAAIVAVVIVLLGAVFVIKGMMSSSGTASQTEDNTATMQPETTSSPGEGAMASSSATEDSSSSATQAGEKDFTVSGSSYKFEPATLTAFKGDKVKITFKNSGGNHDFVIDEYNVRTKIIPSGQEATVEFTADKTGTFDYYCSVANHRAMGMQGTLTVR